MCEYALPKLDRLSNLLVLLGQGFVGIDHVWDVGVVGDLEGVYSLNRHFGGWLLLVDQWGLECWAAVLLEQDGSQYLDLIYDFLAPHRVAG